VVEGCKAKDLRGGLLVAMPPHLRSMTFKDTSLHKLWPADSWNGTNEYCGVENGAYKAYCKSCCIKQGFLW